MCVVYLYMFSKMLEEVSVDVRITLMSTSFLFIHFTFVVFLH